MTKPKRKNKLVHRDDTPIELRRFLCGTWFDESYLLELAANVSNIPPEEVFTLPKPLDMNRIPPSKRGIKTPEQLAQERSEREEAAEAYRIFVEEKNRKAQEEYRNRKPLYIKDERPKPTLYYKRSPELSHPGIMWTVLGAPALFWNSETGQFYTDGQTIGGSDRRIAFVYSDLVKDLLKDGVELEDIAVEVLHAIRSKGMDVISVYIASEEEFKQP